jgi:DNA polymerase II small subunit/DNA polymerase delta subunit B
MSSNILKLFVEKGFLLDKEMLSFLDELNDNEVASEILNKIAVVSHKKIITKELVDENIEKIKPILFDLKEDKKKLVDKYFVNVSISLEVKKERSIEPIDDSIISKDNKDNFNSVEHGSVRILSSPIIASQRVSVKNFIKHFRSRYNIIKKFLQGHPGLINLISIDKINGNGEFSIVGIITNKSITKNKNVILEIEDLTGSVKLLINQNKEEVYKKSKNILLDDIVGFRCNGTKDFLYVNDLFYPDSRIIEINKLEEEIYALFISDIHVGSNNFLENKLIFILNNIK